MKTLHLMTQDGQGYGSARMCCENCGHMLVGRPARDESHCYTESRKVWADPAETLPVGLHGELRLCDGRTNTTPRRRPPPPPLTFERLRKMNLERLPLFRNPRGEPAHARPDGFDWLLSQWSNATLGELGEAANLIKKIERGDTTLEEARDALAAELADAQTYLDLLAHRAGIDPAAATVKKWDEVSVRVGCSLRLLPDETG